MSSESKKDSADSSANPQNSTETGDHAGKASSEGESRKSSHSSHGPAYYYDRRRTGGPSYYSGPSYYGGGNAYGTTLPYYSTNNANNSDDNDNGGSVLGPLSISRVIRVIFQKWPTLVVSVLLGLGAGFAYFKAAPVSYKASAFIEMTVRAGSYIGGTDAVLNSPERTGSPEEIFNTRLAQLRGINVIKLVADRVRTDYPSMKTMSDEELIGMLQGSVEFTLQRRSRLVQISVRNARPEIAQSIANAYAETAHIYSIEQTKIAAEAAAEWLRSMRDGAQAEMTRANNELLKFRIDNQIDVLISQNESLKLTHNQLAGELATAETAQSRATDLLEVLTAIQKDPEKISSLPENVPRAGEIAAAQSAVQNAITERNGLLTKYTDKHPDVELLNSKIKILEQQFQEAVWRARATAAANLSLMTKQTETIRAKEEENVKTQTELGVRISQTENETKRLEAALLLATEKYNQLARRMEQVKLGSEDAQATISVIEQASLPRRQVSPDPRIAFSAGPVLGLIVGFIFILALDRIEDKITSSEDIERHMGTKVLALLPHVPRITRNQLVSLSSDKKFSRFAEAFAGLRGLLESPRFAEITQVVLLVSTQPEEGKTITSSNLAVSYGMAGRKTLLVDFDLRRPRIGRMFGKGDLITDDNSLLDVLDAGDPTKFDGLPIESGYENLDLVASKPTSHISPANVIGSGMLPKFFEWARKNYEHIIIDSPPFGLVSDALALGTLSDSVIIVCRPERSRYGIVNHALRSLAESGSRILGVVVNDVDFGHSGSFGSYSSSNYNYGYGYGYGGRYGRYGYTSNYYRRNVNDKSSSSSATASESDESDAKSKRSSVKERSEPEREVETPESGNVLDVDDD